MNTKLKLMQDMRNAPKKTGAFISVRAFIKVCAETLLDNEEIGEESRTALIAVMSLGRSHSISEYEKAIDRAYNAILDEEMGVSVCG